MGYDRDAPLWRQKERWFADREIPMPVIAGKACVGACLCALAPLERDQLPSINTQDPSTWSDALRHHGMKLAYCPTDIRPVGWYLDEVADIGDLFLVGYYTCSLSEMPPDPTPDGWFAPSHLVILHRDLVLDPLLSAPVSVSEYRWRGKPTKRIFRVVPSTHKRGL